MPVALRGACASAFCFIALVIAGVGPVSAQPTEIVVTPNYVPTAIGTVGWIATGLLALGLAIGLLRSNLE